MSGTLLIIVVAVPAITTVAGFFIFAPRWHNQDADFSPEHCDNKGPDDADDRILMGQPGHGEEWETDCGGILKTKG